MSNYNDHGSKATKPHVTAAGGQKAAPVSSPGTKDTGPLIPKTWPEVKVGSVVIAHESDEDGWWEAVVTEIKGDQLTVRWRDFPRQRPLVVSRKDITFLPTA